MALQRFLSLQDVLVEMVQASLVPMNPETAERCLRPYERSVPEEPRPELEIGSERQGYIKIPSRCLPE